MPFSAKSRRIIKNRSNRLSEVTNLNTQPMHAAHLDHTRGSNYDSPENGLYLRLEEHFYHHLAYRGKAELIGLSEADNENAIAGLYSQWRIWQFRQGEISAVEIVAIIPDYFDRYPWESVES